MTLRKVIRFILRSLSILFVIDDGPTMAAPAERQTLNGNQTILPQTRIINGQSAQRGQFPWQAAVEMDNSYFCGGSIISPTWILTAGHCVYRVRHFTVTVGSIYSGQPPRGVHEPSRATLVSMVGVLHHSYSANTNNNDIGLIRLPLPLIYSLTVGAVALPPATNEFLSLTLRNVTVSGWGRTSDSGQVVPVLQYTDMTVIPSEICAADYRDNTMNQKICCGSLLGHSTCNGDSGGPLTYRGRDGIIYEVGIVSYGANTCTHNIPVVFTRVTSFLTFISNTTGLQEAQSSPSRRPLPFLRHQKH